ncbi:hypothetical protein DFJ74DRAFT_771717 [Hyaloraphidium curvatum]|nr:hypothetical protein DFJ74DRAFT_771717 [Hyaloraphidium curvatum]
MAETPAPARGGAFSLVETPPTYNLRNRLAPREDPLVGDTPTYNLRSRTVARDSPTLGSRLAEIAAEGDDGPEGTGAESRAQWARARWADAAAAAGPVLRRVRDEGKRAARRFARWWAATGWALKAAVACWAVALLLALFAADAPKKQPDLLGRLKEVDAARAVPDVVLQCDAPGDGRVQLQVVDAAPAADVGGELLLVAVKNASKPDAAAASPLGQIAVPVAQMPEEQFYDAAEHPAEDLPATNSTATQTKPLPVPRTPLDQTLWTVVDASQSSQTFHLRPPGFFSGWMAKLLEWATGDGLTVATGGEPDTVVAPLDESAPQCWAMAGDKGRVTFRLAKPLLVSSFSVRHRPPASHGKRSLPRIVSFHRARAPGAAESEGDFLASAHLDPDAQGEATVLEARNNATALDGFEMRVHANWGNPSYTCVYQVQVWGVEADA